MRRATDDFPARGNPFISATRKQASYFVIV